MSEERVPPRTFSTPRPPVPLPPLSFGNWLAAAGAVVCFGLTLVAAIGYPHALWYGAPLLPYFLVLAVGIWRVRPSPEHPRMFTVCAFFHLLQVTVFLLSLWPVAVSTGAGDYWIGPAERALHSVAVLVFALGWIPPLLTLYHGRRGGWLMLAASIGPAVTLAWWAIAAPLAAQ